MLIRRLLAHRGPGAPALTRIDEPGLRAALDGPELAIALLEQLAPVLGVRLPDLR